MQKVQNMFESSVNFSTALLQASVNTGSATGAPAVSTASATGATAAPRKTHAQPFVASSAVI